MDVLIMAIFGNLIQKKQNPPTFAQHNSRRKFMDFISPARSARNRCQWSWKCLCFPFLEISGLSPCNQFLGRHCAFSPPASIVSLTNPIKLACCFTEKKSWKERKLVGQKPDQLVRNSLIGPTANPGACDTVVCACNWILAPWNGETDGGTSWDKAK